MFPKEGWRTREQMEELGGEVLVMPCDLADPDGATKAAINRVTVAEAAENHPIIAVNALTPQVAGGRAVSSERGRGFT